MTPLDLAKSICHEPYKMTTPTTPSAALADMPKLANIEVGDTVYFDSSKVARVASHDFLVAKLSLPRGGFIYRDLSKLTLADADDFAKAAQPIGVRGAVAHCVMKAALLRLSECIAKCPGIGGECDAMNLRHMINSGPIPSALLQSADALLNLSVALDINAEMEIAALREIATY